MAEASAVCHLRDRSVGPEHESVQIVVDVTAGTSVRLSKDDCEQLVAAACRAVEEELTGHLDGLEAAAGDRLPASN